jgi:hypothetical protein
MKPPALLFAATSLVCACHSGESTFGPSETEAAPEAAPEALVIPAEPPGVALERGLHRADITEVLLDPRASAALSLDREGGLRLWTSLGEAADEPLRIPVEAPRDMSLARAEDGSFVLALVDTAGAAEVMEVREHAGEARLAPLFSIPPMDPLFELHVLDGGERLLALGVDHRVRLYDRAGEELASLAEPGFVPWQLRHVETKTGVELIAVLAGPTRVQRLSLRDGELKIVGEPVEIELDRGPNRNDLALTPDGRRVAVLNRPRRRSAQWQLKLVDLRDGSELEFTGESGANMRPRLHLLEGERALLDDGTGVGQLISLAAEAAAGEDEASAPPTLVPLPGSGFHQRLHTGVEAGVRAVPLGDHLVVDPLDRDGHLRLGRRPCTIQSAGLSPDGTQVLWGLAEGWAIEPIEASTSGAPEIHELDDPIVLADFVDEGRVVLVTRGSAALYGTGGELIASVSDLASPTAARFARGDGSLAPALLIHGSRDGLDETIEILTDGFGAREHGLHGASYIGPWSPDSFARPWPNATKAYPGWDHYIDGERELEAALSEALDGDEIDIHEHASAPGGVHYYVGWRLGLELIRTKAPAEDELGVGVVEVRRAFERDVGVVGRLVPSPDGRRFALLHHHGMAVSVYDGASLTSSWTRVDTPANTVAWSDDGERLVIAGDSRGGVIVDANSGEIVLERRDFGLDAQVLDDGEIEAEAEAE